MMMLGPQRTVPGTMEPYSNMHLEADICTNIFTVSAVMVGVCLTVIGLPRVVITIRKADTLAAHPNSGLGDTRCSRSATRHTI